MDGAFPEVIVSADDHASQQTCEERSTSAGAHSGSSGSTNNGAPHEGRMYPDQDSIVYESTDDLEGNLTQDIT